MKEIRLSTIYSSIAAGDADGDGQCAIALRCAKLTENVATLFAGVGIVSGSDPKEEFDETQAKFGPMRDALLNIVH